MSKATDELLEIRVAFEDMERKMQAGIKQAMDKRGMAKAADIMADVARVREALHQLHIKLEQ